MPLEPELDASARAMRDVLRRQGVAPSAFRAALLAVPAGARDAWLDAVLGTGDLPPDGDELPPGCAPYMPCSVDALLDALDGAGVGDHDVFVDLGSGLGRAALAAHLLTGAGAIGVEVQSHLASAARELAARLEVSRCATVHGDATELARFVPIGTVFFLYCPFGGARLEAVLADLEALAQAKPISVCTVDVPPLVPSRPWLELAAQPAAAVAVYRSRPPQLACR